jgi:spermidine synthase
MSPWDCIDHEALPDDEGVIYLMARGGEYVIYVEGRELMSNELHGSEDALAELACDQLAELDDARILVGGLGVGFTLAAALRRIGERGRVTVSELMPAVVRWNHEHLGRFAGQPLLDPRVEVFVGDVGDLVEHPPTPRWSAILLDVDNGPGALTRSTNGWLYSGHGLRMARAALIPGGVLGFWAAAWDASLTARLRRAGFETQVVLHHEEGRPTEDDRGVHVLWMAQTPSA